jgi:hypothetical protein
LGVQAIAQGADRINKETEAAAARTGRFLKSEVKGAVKAVPRFVKNLPQTIKTAATAVNTMQAIATNPVLAYKLGSAVVKNREALAKAAVGAAKQAGNAALNADPDAVGEFVGEQLFWAATGGLGYTEEGAALASKASALSAALKTSDAWPSIVPEGGFLPPKVAATFEGFNYTARELAEDATVFRGEGPRFGRFYGTKWAGSAAEAERLFNVTDYGNDLVEMSTYVIPKGTQVFEGPVAGGTGFQLYVPNPRAAGVRLLKTEPLVQYGH